MKRRSGTSRKASRSTTVRPSPETGGNASRHQRTDRRPARRDRLRRVARGAGQPGCRDRDHLRLGTDARSASDGQRRGARARRAHDRDPARLLFHRRLRSRDRTAACAPRGRPGGQGDRGGCARSDHRGDRALARLCDRHPRPTQLSEDPRPRRRLLVGGICRTAASVCELPADVGQLVRVPHHADRGDGVVLHGHHVDAVQPPSHAQHEGRLAVDLGDVERDRFQRHTGGRRRPANADQQSDHLLPAEDRTPRRRRLPAAVAPETDVLSQDAGQCRLAAFAEGANKALDQRSFFLHRRAESRLAFCNPPPGAVEQLAAVRRRHLEHAGDLLVFVVEHFAQQKHRALFGRQRFEQHDERERHRFRERQRSFRLAPVVGGDRLRQPGADVLLAGRARRLQPVEAQARDDRRQIRLDGAEAVGLGRRVAEPRVLQHVLRLGGAAEHPVRDREQRRAVGLKEIDLGHDSGGPSCRLRKPLANRRERRPPAELGARLRVCQRQLKRDHPRHVRGDETRQPHRYRDRPRRAGGLGQRAHDLAEAHRLVVDDVVAAAGRTAIERRHRRPRRIVDMDAREQAAIAADCRQHAPFRHGDHLDRRGGLRTIEQAVAQHDALDRARTAGVENLRLHRVDRRGGLGDVGGNAELLAANQRERSGNDSRRAGGNRGGDQIARALGAQPVGRLEIARAFGPAFGERRELMDDVRGTSRADCTVERVGVERIDDHRRGAEALQFRGVGGRAGGRRHLMTGGDELADQRNANRSRSSGYEYVHDDPPDGSASGPRPR